MTTRLPIAPERIADTLSLTSDERHYLVDVLRLCDGDAIEVFDGLGGRYLARLSLLNGEGALLLGERQAEVEETSGVSLAPALIKNDRLDWVVEKATELGAMRVLPLQCDNCVVRLDGIKGGQRQARWQKIAQAASRQCGRAFIPEVTAPARLEEVLGRARDAGEVAIILFEREVERSFSEVVRSMDPKQPILIVSGPEGGFREEEIARARALGARTVSLGKRILRAETAPIAALAIAQALRGEM